MRGRYPGGLSVTSLVKISRSSTRLFRKPWQCYLSGFFVDGRLYRDFRKEFSPINVAIEAYVLVSGITSPSVFELGSLARSWLLAAPLEDPKCEQFLINHSRLACCQMRSLSVCLLLFCRLSAAGKSFAAQVRQEFLAVVRLTQLPYLVGEVGSRLTSAQLFL